MKKTKHLILTLVAVFLVTATILGTVAYLTSTKKVTNTFTVGDVELDIDEAVVTPDGKPTGGRTTEGNDYHLIPGMSYTKDPTASVKAGSEACYVRMVVTFTDYAELNALRTEFDVKDFFQGINLNNWFTDGKVTVDSATGTGTVVFYYTGKHADSVTTIVPATDKDLELEPLFTSFKVPGTLNNKELAVFQDMKVSVEAQAIQAAGFEDVKLAWAAFEAQNGN